MTEHAGQALILALVLILPLSALVSRRLPLSTTVRYALVWAAIFGVGFMIVASFT